jgi:DNA polymerase-3 subunit delta'
MTRSTPSEAIGASDALFAGVVGQERAVAQLRAAARQPVHAYMLIAPPGTGARILARAFAAAVLCPRGGCAGCDVCRRVLAGVHPDLVEVERTGAALTVQDAHDIVRVAHRRPLEATRQVLVVGDIDLARLAAPVLLKTLEEPPGPTVFVLLAESVPPELVTVASRCVQVRLDAVADATVRAWLVGRGVAADLADDLAVAAAGNLERAELLADDAELVAACERAVEPVRVRHQREIEQAVAEAEALGQRNPPGRKEMEDRQRREERRWRIDALRGGLAALAASYRDRLLVETRSAGGARHGERVSALVAAVADIDHATAELVRNPNETLLVEALLVRLSAAAR